MKRICLVGAGSIAQAHAAALQTFPRLSIAAVVDPNLDAARRFAVTWQVTEVYGSIREALMSGTFDAAHVLAPPDIHAEAALPFLEAGVPVLIEKPMAASLGECDALLAASRASGAMLGVNQNFLFHPAFLRLRRAIATGRYGQPRFVDCIYNLPLRQLAARQFGHWMFHAPGNILLEQAVHPLSQITALAGPVQDLRAISGPPVEIAPGLAFHPATTMTLSCAALPAQLRFAVGQSFPFWQLSVVCDDGVVVADILANRVFSHARTRWIEALDGALSGARTAAGIFGAGLGNAIRYALSMLRLRGRSDPFFLSMKGSIGAFHSALCGGPAFESDANFGAMLVRTCERIRDAAFGESLPALSARPAAPALSSMACDVAVLGGTGFIGTATVARLLREGLRVAVMARSIRNLPGVFADPRVVLHRGDVRDREAIAQAIGEAPAVVNLAHGGGSGNFEAVRQAMVSGVETVAHTCLAHGVRRLVHIGSIASLYLGPQPGAITGMTPPDPMASRRADYARAKALCDRLLLDLHAREGLPVCILRPGLVVGEGGSPFHSGLGFFNNDQHCIGWNDGRNPLPFVLVTDVADAILLALRASGVDGRCYNLVGDVRMSARDYVAALALALGRPLRFHPKRAGALWAEELGKWLIKCAGGRSSPLPSYRDILSRGLCATFDCSDTKRDLGWQPVADPAVFVAKAIAVHAT